MKKRTLLLAAVVSGAVLNISTFALADSQMPICYYDEECADLIVLGDGSSAGGESSSGGGESSGGGSSSGGGTSGGGTAGGGTAGGGTAGVS
ncbi:MAG: hypothetical protein ABJN40_19480 [Sneathiella sp.]